MLYGICFKTDHSSPDNAGFLGNNEIEGTKNSFKKTITPSESATVWFSNSFVSSCFIVSFACRFMSLDTKRHIRRYSSGRKAIHPAGAIQKAKSDSSATARPMEDSAGSSVSIGTTESELDDASDFDVAAAGVWIFSRRFLPRKIFSLIVFTRFSISSHSAPPNSRDIKKQSSLQVLENNSNGLTSSQCPHFRRTRRTLIP
mmetsp:Transcript_59541/g.145891  ORF Transcript_59541/g.145891 Transcript_59541/m.145891 type:complete len:201 (-) Transcript_59541:1374-1976(-)